MVNLNKLTVPYLNQLAKELSITFKRSSKKPDKIKTILNAGIPDKKLEDLYNKYLNQHQASKGKSTVTKKKSIKQNIISTDRINLLEKQVKFIMSKIDNIEIQLAKDRSSKFTGGVYNLNDVQNIIKSKISRGDSVSIDEVMVIKKLKKFPRELIEKAILDLIDDEIFDVSEGRSIQKIQGNIGRLIRR